MDELTRTAAENDGIREFLIFSVDTIEFGIDIGLVQEIIKFQPVSPMPNAHPYCKGIINIRGLIVPVLDMRTKLGFPSAEYHERTCIIVVRLDTESVGIIVDQVKDVIRLREEELSDAPALNGERKGYTAKIANTDGKIRQILNVNAVFDVELG